MEEVLLLGEAGGVCEPAPPQPQGTARGGRGGWETKPESRHVISCFRYRDQAALRNARTEATRWHAVIAARWLYESDSP